MRYRKWSPLSLSMCVCVLCGYLCVMTRNIVEYFDSRVQEGDKIQPFQHILPFYWRVNDHAKGFGLFLTSVLLQSSHPNNWT